MDKEIYRGQYPPKNTNLMWVKGKQIYLFDGTTGTWVEVNESTQVDQTFNPTSERAVSAPAILNAAEENLSEDSENLIKNRAVYNQYMTEDDILDIPVVFDSIYRKIPLTFKILIEGTITWHSSNTYSIQYSKNKGEWIELIPASSLDVIEGDIIEFKGNIAATGYGFYTSTCSFDVYGNIMSLSDGDNFASADTLQNNAQFQALFVMTNVIDASNLCLPATTLTENAYLGLFQACASLIKAPRFLPATIMQPLCYGSMFNQCLNLITTPKILATTSAYRCCYCMFQYCYALQEVPELLAIELAEECYAFMFNYCTSLIKAPKLPATILAKGCYKDMFQRCENLVEAPNLPATTLAYGCYEDMFHSCTSITKAPVLPATIMAAYCYYMMFRGCTNLIEVPELHSTSLANGCYYRMFGGCTNLKTAPELPATTLADRCYESMFEMCENLEKAPELPAKTLESRCYWGMFWHCYKLNYIKCLATDISASDCMDEWVNDVAANGIFYKDANMNNWPTGNSGIPSGWTVQDASE